MAVKRACGSAASTPVRGTETRWLLCDDRRERTQPATGGLFVGSRCRASVSVSLNLAAKPVAIVERREENVLEVCMVVGKNRTVATL